MPTPVGVGTSGTPRAALTCTRPVGRAGQVSLGAGSGLPRSSRFSQGYGPNVCLTLFCCCMAWCHIRELVWNWLDTQSRLKVVAAGGIRGCRVDWILGRPTFSIYCTPSPSDSYRLGVFPVPHGSVDSNMFPSSDPLMPATLAHGKVAPCPILCWFVFTWRKRETTLVLMSEVKMCISILSLTSVMRIWVSCCGFCFVGPSH